MRVRKAVPEGYKTQCVTEMRSDPEALPANPQELAPFCGIHKIGGHSAQWNMSSDSAESAIAFQQICVDPTDLDFATSSQDSSMSTLSSESMHHPHALPCLSRKRSLDEDHDGDDEVRGQTDTTLTAYAGDRLVARAVSRKPEQAMRNLRPIYTNHPAVEEDDFEDADFLRP